MKGGNAAVWLLVVLGGVPVAEGARSLQAMARFMPFMGSSSGLGLGFRVRYRAHTAVSRM
jgi:hypothetical protein